MFEISSPFLSTTYTTSIQDGGFYQEIHKTRN